MTSNHMIVFADADPPMVPLMVGARLARVEALGTFAVYEGLAADAVEYEARISNATDRGRGSQHRRPSGVEPARPDRAMDDG